VPSNRLTNVLAQQFRQYLKNEANILLWRHAAIAISRRHLRQAKFRKDYARGIEEAPGHVASARADYRQISREWHTFLGFSGFTRPVQLQLGAAPAFYPRPSSEALINRRPPQPLLKRPALTEIPAPDNAIREAKQQSGY
jgi:hypothetical protein